MPLYLFRQCPAASAAVRERPLVENLALALDALAKMGIDVRYDSGAMYVDKDAGGERVEIVVGTKQSIGWHVDHARLLSKHGVIVMTVKPV